MRDALMVGWLDVMLNGDRRGMQGPLQSIYVVTCQQQLDVPSARFNCPRL